MNFLDLNHVGLILNMVGTLGLFIWGLPSKIKSNNDFIVDADKTGKEADNINKFNKWLKYKANISLGLIFFGFLCQFFANFF